MRKIAVIDLLFNWPPDGGARVDLKEILVRLSKLYKVKTVRSRICNLLFPSR
jgi:hypothetical protein